MQRKLIVTDDRSNSISIPELNVNYHSIHGAFRESMHVYIKAGLIKTMQTAADPFNIKIFELGFGTGLNALLTLLTIEELDLQVHYETIEPFPLEDELIKQLNYCKFLERDDLQSLFEKMHYGEWDTETEVTNNFSFRKSQTELKNYRTPEQKSLIYFDAFDPEVQPELWRKEIFEKMFAMLKPGGILVTYNGEEVVRKSMKAAGFQVEKLRGPQEKGEITRATKIQ